MSEKAKIIALRHLSDDPLTLEKLGALLKISKERVRQIENRALKKLKSLVKTNIKSSPIH